MMSHHRYLPLTAATCHSPSLPATHCRYLPLTAATCHSPPLPATHRRYLPLTAATCHSPPLPATHCRYLPLTAATCHSLPLPATHCRYLPLTAATCHSLPLPATHCRYLPLPATHCRYLLLTAATCYLASSARYKTDKTTTLIARRLDCHLVVAAELDTMMCEVRTVAVRKGERARCDMRTGLSVRMRVATLSVSIMHAWACKQEYTWQCHDWNCLSGYYSHLGITATSQSRSPQESYRIIELFISPIT